MNISFFNSFQSEWIKKRRSASSWLLISGAVMVPLIIMLSLFIRPETITKAADSGHYWEFMYGRSWPAMGMFLLPMGIILVASLITQLEFKNNTWKQLHTTPQTFTTIFFAKLSVIILMLLQFFILFNIGIYLSGIIPAFAKGVSLSKESFPFTAYLRGNGKFFIDCLPILALQYLISLQFKNFLVPVGAGLGMYVAAMIALNWKYCYTVPYSYCALNFKDNRDMMDPTANIHVWALGYFVAFITAAYFLYLRKKEKG